MASTYSSRLRIELIGTGEQSGIWGDTTNTNLGTLIDEAVAGVASITMSDADYTLTVADGATDQSRKAVLVMAGTLSAARNVICPSSQKVYIVKNSTTGGFSITIKTSAGSGYAVANGTTALVYCDGTDVFLAADITDTTDPTFTGNISLDGAVVVNDSGADKDFRVEGDTDANLIFSDASTDRVGIGTNTPTEKLTVSGNVAVTGTLGVTGDSSLNGAVVINDAGADKDTRIEGDADPNLVFVDASTDKVGIGTNTPTEKLDVSGTAKATTFSGSGASLTNLPLAGIESGSATNGQVLSWNGSAWAPATISTQAFPSGTVMLFGQTSAPTGWTKDTTNYNNSALRVVTGAAGTGGTADFTTVFTSRTPAGSVSSSFSSGSTSSVTATGSVAVSGGSVGATTLATTQIPSHNHTINFVASSFALTAGANSIGASSSGSTGSTGGGGSHTHTFTTPTATFTGNSHSHTVSGTVTSSFTGTAMDFAVKYVDVIRASKD